MKYTRFEELPVWNAAIELAVGVFALTAKGCFRGHCLRSLGLLTGKIAGARDLRLQILDLRFQIQNSL